MPRILSDEDFDEIQNTMEIIQKHIKSMDIRVFEESTVKILTEYTLDFIYQINASSFYLSDRSIERNEEIVNKIKYLLRG
jgi:hypothetical protein